MDRSEIIALEDQYGSGLYPKRPLVLVRGEGTRVWDARGQEYIDRGAPQKLYRSEVCLL